MVNFPETKDLGVLTGSHRTGDCLICTQQKQAGMEETGRKDSRQEKGKMLMLRFQWDLLGKDKLMSVKCHATLKDVHLFPFVS